MPHAEKRDGKLTGFWYGEVDRRHKGGERFPTPVRDQDKSRGLRSLREGDRRGAAGAR